MERSFDRYSGLTKTEFSNSALLFSLVYEVQAI